MFERNSKKNNDILTLVIFLVSLVKRKAGKYLQTPSELFGDNLHLQLFEPKGF